MSDLPDEIQTVLSNLDSSLSSLEEYLDPLFEVPWDELTGRLDPLEKAKLNLMMAYAASSLFYMYLKSQVLEFRHDIIAGCLTKANIPIIREYRLKITQFSRSWQGYIHTSENSKKRQVSGAVCLIRLWPSSFRLIGNVLQQTRKKKRLACDWTQMQPSDLSRRDWYVSVFDVSNLSGWFFYIRQSRKDRMKEDDETEASAEPVEHDSEENKSSKKKSKKWFSVFCQTILGTVWSSKET